MDDMRSRIARGDIQLERAEAIKVCTEFQRVQHMLTVNEGYV